MAGPTLTIEFLGADSVARLLKQYHDRAIPALAAGMYQVGTAVIADAIPRTPKKTGTLRSSGYIALPVISGNSVTVTGGFGGFAKAYAWVQHENMTYRHTEGGPKYLERALAAKEQGAAEHVANVIAKAFETGTTPPLGGNGLPTSPSGIAEARAAKRTAATARRAARAARKAERGAARLAKAKAAKTKARKKAVAKIGKGFKKAAKGAKKAAVKAAKATRRGAKKAGKAVRRGARKLRPRGKRRRK